MGVDRKEKIRKVVYSPIVADMFHYGHLQSLKFANSQGDFHICGVLTDKASQYYKKKLISNFEERKAVISSLNFIDRVVTQEHEDPTGNLRKIHEEFRDAQIILVHGDDWRTIPGTRYINEIGGKVVIHPYYTNLSDIRIIRNFLERYKGKFKDAVEFLKYFDLKDFTYYNPRKIKETVFSSKADTLSYLKPLLKKSKIEEIFVFTVIDWKEEKNDLIGQIRKLFSPSRIVVRSSSLSEDSSESSMAGYFHSELNVDSKSRGAIENAVEKIINSYNEKKSDFMINQILVQPHTEAVVLSGVAFTRTIEKNSPYYVISYDDTTGSTDRVTKGIEGKTVKISRFCQPENYPKNIRRLMSSIKEVESLIPGIGLDIEFAVNKKDEVTIFQVRPLSLAKEANEELDYKVKRRISELKKKFRLLSRRVNHLAGNLNCFGDMPDWNPAEIIGDNPNYLDFSLYDFAITNSAWHQARSSQGYTNVNPAQLVVLFGNKPYIDVRNTFNSFLPNDLPKRLKEKLVNFYIGKLNRNPELQDKVEFEILYTCYDLGFDKRARELSKAGFTNQEIRQLKESVLRLTNNLISNSKETIRKDMNSVFLMGKTRKLVARNAKNASNNANELLRNAKMLLQDCRQNGTVQFSRLARLAFVGNIILKSMVKEGTISGQFYDSFMSSITTVAKQLSTDFDRLMEGAVSKKEFLRLYGHLRPGTYDITSMRYDKNPHLFRWSRAKKVSHDKKSAFRIPEELHRIITKELKNHGISADSGELFEFVRSAIESRELSKFEFTKSLSEAIELIAKAGKSLGFTREGMPQLDYGILFSNLNLSRGELTAKWENAIKRRKQEKELNDCLMLPPIIFSEKDFECVSYYAPRPNFITQKRVDAHLANLSQGDKKEAIDIQGKIVMIENGDPGYDWIFTKNPSGLITKYGGVASHMSIRSAEFGLPAAIGCGDIFERLKLCDSAILDCGLKRIIPLK